jgi:uncharacterized protein (TIRG00374 family)
MNSKQILDSRGRRLGSVAKGVLGLGVSAAFVCLMLQGIDLSQISERIRALDPRMLFPAVASLAAIFIYKAFRWKYQLSILKTIAFNRGLSAIIVGFTANNAIPLRGGDLLRAHVLAKSENLGTVTVLATVALERVFDGVALLTFALGMLLMFPLPPWMRTSMIILGVALAVCALTVLIFQSGRKFIANKWEICRRRLPGKWQEILFAFFGQISSGLQTSRGYTRLMMLYVLAMGEWVFWVALTGFSLKALGIEPSIPLIISIVLAIDLAMLLPAAPGYIGVFDYAVMLTLLFYGFDRSTAFSGAVTLHVIFVLPVSAIGCLLLIREYLLFKANRAGPPQAFAFGRNGFRQHDKLEREQSEVKVS